MPNGVSSRVRRFQSEEQDRNLVKHCRGHYRYYCFVISDYFMIEVKNRVIARFTLGSGL